MCALLLFGHLAAAVMQFMTKLLVVPQRGYVIPRRLWEILRAISANMIEPELIDDASANQNCLQMAQENIQI